MTDLTEKYKKGKLDLDHSYYLKLKDGRIEIQLYVGGFIMEEDNEVIEVLAEVPTYEEYQALLSDQLAKKEGVEINAELEAENERLKTFLKKAINLVMESNWENHAHYKESIQLRDETNNLLNDSPSPTDLKQG